MAYEPEILEILNRIGEGDFSGVEYHRTVEPHTLRNYRYLGQTSVTSEGCSVDQILVYQSEEGEVLATSPTTDWE